MGLDETPKKKLKRDHSQKDHSKSKPASESKPKRKSESKKAKKSDQGTPVKEKKKTKPQSEEPKAENSKKKKESSSRKSEETTEILTKPGQKHPDPSLDDPTRAFYESLYEQNPTSHMAQKYCLEYGLLPEDTAAKLAEALKKKTK